MYLDWNIEGEVGVNGQAISQCAAGVQVQMVATAVSWAHIVFCSFHWDQL